MSNNDFPFGGGNQPPAHQPQPQYQPQNARAPTLNGAAQQQMPATMPSLAPDLQALLQGVTPEQFAAIARALQSGSIPLPPAGFAPPQPIAPTLTPVNADPRPPQPRHAAIAPEPHPSNGDVDMDHEDGEVEDGEVDGTNTTQARGFLRTPPKGPASSRRGSHQHTNLAQNGARPGMTPRASASTIPKAFVANGKVPDTPSRNAQAVPRPNKEAASKAFVLEMHKAGYTYDDLAREVKDHKMLRRLYVQLGLPIPSSSSVKAPATSKPVASPVNAVRKQPAAPPAKAPEKADRSAYLAKLAAVKGRKTEAAKASATPPASTRAPQPTEVQPVLLQTASPSQALPSASAPTPLPSVAAAQPAAVATPVVKAPVLSHDKNVLLRKKLEALRAEQAAKQRAKSSGEAILPSSPAPQQVAQPSRTGLGAGLNEAAATVARQIVPATVHTQPTQYTAASSTTGSPIVNRSGFSLPGLSLPGLFPTHNLPAAPPSSSPRPNTNPPAQTPTIAVAEQQNAMGADQSSSGQRNNANSPERYVIEVSSEDEREGEDDDDGDAMDIDGSSEDEQAQRGNPPAAIPSKAMAPLSSLPNSAGPSAPGTPNVWQRKLEEAEALRQKIAEMERRRKVQPSTSAVPSSSSGGLPAALARLGNGINGSLVVNGSLDSQSKAVEIPAQQADSQLDKPDQLRAKHDSGSPALLVPADSRPHAANDPPTVNANTTSDIDDDDDDDEDLYGGDGDTQVSQYQQAQDTRGVSYLGSQATTVSEDSVVGTAKTSQVAATADQTDDDLRHAMDVDNDPVEQRSQAADTVITPSDKNNESEEDDDDDLDNIYEPPSAIEVVSQAQEPVDTPAAGANDQDSDDAMDTSEESSSDSDENEDEDEDEDGRGSAHPEPVSAEAEAPSPPARSLVSPSVNDKETARAQSLEETDLAPELQRANDEHETTPKDDEPKTKTRYTPYDSALKRFKDYSYHPDFTNTVPSGFKSLTFSHKIDPNKAVCPAELYDGQCKDGNCGWQHFREMNLQDNELLRLMGTEKIPARDPEQKQKWNQGLGDLINELRSDPKVGRNAGLIAQRIAEYRRTFVKDPTRVVLVDD